MATFLRAILRVDVCLSLVSAVVILVGLTAGLIGKIKPFRGRSFRLLPATANITPPQLVRFVACWIFSPTLVMGLACSLLLRHLGRQEILAYIQAHESAATVWINGQRVADPHPFFRALRSIHLFRGAGSHPEDRILIVIKGADGTEFSFSLGRDSINVDDYWIFLPSHQITDSPIGWIHTDVFRPRLGSRSEPR